CSTARRGERAGELEGIIVAEVRCATSVLETAKEQTKTAADDSLVDGGVGHSDSRREVCFLPIDQVRVFRILKSDVVLGQQREEGWSKRGSALLVREDVRASPGARTSWGSYKVRLAAGVLADRLNVLVAKAEVQRELRHDLPIVLGICGAIPADIVELRESGDGRSVHLVGEKVCHAIAGVCGAQFAGIQAVESIGA